MTHKTKFFSATVYSRLFNQQKLVGITFEPTPKLNSEELKELIRDLKRLLQQME